MLKYELSKNIRDKMAGDEPAVKAALCHIANENFKTDRIEGIGKFEGGIKVNGKEIVIKESWVMDDWGRPREPIPEEEAVVGAINTVASIIESEGVEGLKSRYGRCRIGDPLRNLTNC